MSSESGGSAGIQHTVKLFACKHGHAKTDAGSIIFCSSSLGDVTFLPNATKGDFVDQEPVRKKHGILRYIGCGLAVIVGLPIIFFIVVVIIPGLIIGHRNQNNNQPTQTILLTPPLTQEELQKRWLDGDQLAVRMPQYQELYRSLRDETWAAFQQLHPGTHPYDDKARQIISVLTYLRVWGDYYGENLFRDAGSLYMFAKKEGLQDPLFDAMLDFNFFSGYYHSREASQCAEVNKRSEALEATTYPVAFKFWAATNTAYNIIKCRDYNVPQAVDYWPLVSPLAERVLTYYEEMFRQKYPEHFLYDRAEDWMDDLQSDPALLEQAGAKIDAIWARHAPDSPTRLAVQGGYEINAAWAARSSKWASQVSEQGWKGMEFHLGKARQILESAYERYPEEWLIADLMMNVILGGSGDRAEMEKWFQRGVKANPNSRDIYTCKAHYLLPRWHGSKREEVEFGKECLAGGRFDLKVPLILANNIKCYPDDFGDDIYRVNWDLFRTAFEGYLQKYPRSDYYRSLYVLFAYKAGQEKIVAEQCRLLGDYLDDEAIPSQILMELREKYQTSP